MVNWDTVYQKRGVWRLFVRHVLFTDQNKTDNCCSVSNTLKERTYEFPNGNSPILPVSVTWGKIMRQTETRFRQWGKEIEKMKEKIGRLEDKRKRRMGKCVKPRKWDKLMIDDWERIRQKNGEKEHLDHQMKKWENENWLSDSHFQKVYGDPTAD